MMVGLAKGNPLTAQTSTQTWYEYMLNYSFANSFNLENAFTYSTVIGQPKWRSLEYNGTLEYSISPHFDLLGAGLISYTAQTETYNTLELRPMVGTRIFFTPTKRIQARLLLRLEDRNIQHLDTKEWENSIRPRVRAEMIIPISQDSYFKDNLWYGITDVEAMFTSDDVKERFANRFRFRIGVGYRLNYSLRFELMYMNQESRDGLDESLTSTENVIRFRFKHFLRKSKPSKATGVGN
jgi:Protein of unknown function (DUF2490)